ncbi:MAG: hypothetical protein GQ573_02315 [Gammaproteobacteria bacterium]|nr:hypothetical protein [Gammaproteobacteria bacterium]
MAQTNTGTSLYIQGILVDKNQFTAFVAGYAEG